MSMLVRNPYLIALGSNLAAEAVDNRIVIAAALVSLANRFDAQVSVSRYWRTPAYPPGTGPEFVNACASLESHLPPEAVLAILHEIEADMGRERRERWGPRVIDLDLLAQGSRVLPDRATQGNWMDLPPDQQRRVAPDQLILPHPRLQDRAFVLVPLAEVAPHWHHPVLGLSVIQMRDALDPADLKGVVPL
jgi:2-amino-4-hydroxy-6-hydroxymethyldihydropteridine diphosphokinase